MACRRRLLPLPATWTGLCRRGRRQPWTGPCRAGNVVILPGSEVDLLLGFEPRTSRIQFEITLDQGATVLLYTDGLIEHRGEDLDTGLARLRDTLGELAHLPLDEMCDELLLRMQPATDDDVAFIAVRLPTQHQPVHSHDDDAPTGAVE